MSSSGNGMTYAKAYEATLICETTKPGAERDAKLKKIGVKSIMDVAKHVFFARQKRSAGSLDFD